jgi:endonuclease G
MKRLLTAIVVIMTAVMAYAQDTPNTLRYKLRGGTTVDIPLKELKEIKKIANISMRNIYIDENRDYDEFMLEDIESIDFVYIEPIPNDNLNMNMERYARRLEIPHLNAYGEKNLFIEHSTKDYGVTYALEWDCDKKSQRWTCYQFHDGLPKDESVGRSSSWKDDPDIPSAYRTHDRDFKGTGFSRGHMCASDDRKSSEDQNKQTFYISNAHPQYQSHNGALWVTLEKAVNTWGNSSSFRDTLYVVKAGTIDEEAPYDGEDITLGYTTSSEGTNLLVPGYFYMAVLCLKDEEYKAIAFWTKHEDKSITKANPKNYAISIDELEKRTGIDFFCNLPDDIEAQVEESYDLKDWNLE